MQDTLENIYICTIIRNHYYFKLLNDINQLAMKALKILFVMMLVSLQVGATGYSHNMFVAQKVLKSKKTTQKIKVRPVHITAQPTVVKPSPCTTANQSQEEDSFLLPESTAVSLLQCATRWIVRVVSIDGQVLEEKFVSLFADEEEVEKGLPSNVCFLSLTENIVYYLSAPLKSII